MLFALFHLFQASRFFLLGMLGITVTVFVFFLVNLVAGTIVISFVTLGVNFGP